MPNEFDLADGMSIPAIGLGTYPMKGDEATAAVREAIRLGYRLIDSATTYRNEEAVGRAIIDAEVPRGELTVTTKLRGRDHGYDETLRGFEASRKRFGLEQIDLYLIHWPLPRVNKYVESWRAMIKLRDDGLARSIGVSNFTAVGIDRLATETGVLPVVNQIEMHPYFPQAEMRAANQVRGVVTESWRPLGRSKTLLDEPALAQAVKHHGVTPGQVVLRWHHQLGVVPIPKSGEPGRQAENLDIFGFELDEDEMAAIAALARPDGRSGGDPETHEEF